MWFIQGDRSTADIFTHLLLGTMRYPCTSGVCII